MKKLSLALFCVLAASVAFAGGSIFGGGSKRKNNPDGVSSIGIKICGNLLCPEVIIKKGDCNGIDHATQQYGVCVCDKGYLVFDGQCVEENEINCKKANKKWCPVSKTCPDSGNCCEGLTVSECQDCNSDTGQITDKDSGLCTIGTADDAGYCFDGQCHNPCDDTLLENCKTKVPHLGICICEECDEGYYKDGNECYLCPTFPPCVTAGTVYNTILPNGCPSPKITYCSDETPICNQVSGECEPCPSDKPVWDSNNHTCKICSPPVESCLISDKIEDSNGCVVQTPITCSGTTPVCNADGQCEDCPKANKDGVCVDCLANYGTGLIGACTNSQMPVCNSNNECVSCENGTYWNNNTKTCTSCLANYSTGQTGECIKNDAPWCDVSDYICKSCPEGTYWNSIAKTCTKCFESEEVTIESAVFAGDTKKGESRLIKELGPFGCPYNLYVKGHIDDTFLITDEDGNTLCRGAQTTHNHDVDGVIYRILPGKKVKLYAVDNHGMWLAWELNDTNGGSKGTPQKPIMELQLSDSLDCYCNADLGCSSGCSSTPIDYCALGEPVSCPSGTSLTGQGGSAVPAQCKCDIVNTAWNMATNKCECPTGQEIVTLDNGTTQCTNVCRADQRHDTANDGSCICATAGYENVPEISACKPKCIGDQERDPANGYNCICPNAGTLKGEVCCNATTNFAWNPLLRTYSVVSVESCGCPTVEFTDKDNACSVCSTETDPRFVGSDGICRNCSVTQPIITNSSDDCILVCGASRRRYDAESGECKLNTCVEGEFYDKQGNCYACNTDSVPVTEESSCRLCDSFTQRSMITLQSGDRGCAKPCEAGQFHDWDGTCRECSDTSWYHTDESESNLCKDTSSPRIYLASDKVSYNCSFDNDLTVPRSQCDNCGTKRLWRTNQSGVEVCRKACETGYFLDIYGQCQSCSADATTTLPQDSESCPDRFYGSDGKSYACNSTETPESTEDQCNRCGTFIDGETTVYRRIISDGKCIYNCGSGKFYDNNKTCYSCTKNELIKTTVEESNRCSERFYIYDDTSDNSFDGSSWLCTYNRSSGKATSDQCNRCSNRVMIDGYCVLKTCTSANQFRASNRSCYYCYNNPSYEVLDSSYCEDQCNTAGQTADNLRETVVIDGKNMCQRKNCPTNYYREESTGTCKDCNANGRVMTDGEIAQCSATAYPLFKASDGKAYLCSESSGKATASEADCKTYCPVREYSNGMCYNSVCTGFRRTDGTCYSCTKNELIKTTVEESNRCSERFYIYDDTSDSSYDGSSWLCTYNRSSGKATEEQCNRCSNRVMIGEYCVLKCGDKKLHKADRTCVACSDMNPIKAYSDLGEQARECSGQCGEQRKMYGEYCALAYCNYSAGNNNGYFHRSSDGACFTCDSNDKVAVTGSAERAECTACGNREVFNGLCVKKCNAGQFHSADGGCYACDSPDEITTTPDAITVCGEGVRCIDTNGISTLCP